MKCLLRTQEQYPQAQYPVGGNPYYPTTSAPLTDVNSPFVVPNPSAHDLAAVGMSMERMSLGAAGMGDLMARCQQVVILAHALISKFPGVASPKSISVYKRCS